MKRFLDILKKTPCFSQIGGSPSRMRISLKKSESFSQIGRLPKKMRLF